MSNQGSNDSYIDYGNKNFFLSFFADDVDENVIDDEKGGKTLQKDLQYLK